MIGKNVVTDFSSKASEPVIDPTAYVHPLGVVIGIASGQTVACVYSRWVFARETSARTARGEAA